MPFKANFQDIPAERYQYLRIKCGLSEKSDGAVAIGLKNSLCSVAIIHTGQSNEIIGMGRIVGDAGCHCLVVDICVLPDYQGKGLVKLIMQKLDEFIVEHLPPSCYVSLIADGKSHELYAQYGFNEVWPKSRGMGRKINN